MTLSKPSKGYFAGGKFQIYVPAEIVNDSQFPFKQGDKGIVSVELKVSIERNRLIIEPKNDIAEKVRPLTKTWKK